MLFCKKVRRNTLFLGFEETKGTEIPVIRNSSVEENVCRSYTFVNPWVGDNARMLSWYRGEKQGKHNHQRD
jgi:hypothetical protein